MTTRNLEALITPSAIALVGASNEAGSIGAVLSRNLLEGGFSGPILPVNPHARAIRSSLSYSSVADLPLAPELAVIATPPSTVPSLIAELGNRGCRAAVIITAGIDAESRQRMLEAARPHLLRIVGPNCLGVMSPAHGINASFAHLRPAAGNLALVAQSGAIATAAIDWAAARGVGFSHIVTLGDSADVDFGDMLDFLAVDDATRSIVLYVEAISDARKFLSAGRIAARCKPVVVIKGGRSAAGAKAAYSHTGALAGSDAVYDAAFRRAGMLRVEDIRDLFDAVSLLTTSPRIAGERLVVMTNGGGAGVLAADAMETAGLPLKPLSSETLARLNKILPSTWSHANPVDLIGDASPERYARTLAAILAAPEADAVLVLNCPTAIADGDAVAREVITTVKAASRSPKPVLTAWIGEATAAGARRLLADADLPAHETPHEAVRAFGHLVQHRRNQQMMLETPPRGAEPPDRGGARRLVEAVLASGRVTLSEPEAKSLLEAYGVSVAGSRVAHTPAEAAQAAAELEAPYALKILSPDLTHKSDLGGVRLNIPAAPDVAFEAEAMLGRIRAAAPEARLEGFIVQAMVMRPRARELICGIACDAAFGPVVLFGEGGVAVEVRADRAVALPPLNRNLAHDLIRRTRIDRLLQPYRDRPGADVDAVADVLERLSTLALDLPEVAELDINPLLADEHGVIALDARVRLDANPPAKPAIRPYPLELIGKLDLADGESVAVRPVRPDDAPALGVLVEKTSPEDRRLRFHGVMRQLPTGLAARLSQIDYDREMAFAAETTDGAILGVARLNADPDGRQAEFALLVRTDWHGRGLGRRLLQRLLEYAADHGIERVWGSVMHENEPMLTLTRALGFERVPGDDPGSVRVEWRACGD